MTSAIHPVPVEAGRGARDPLSRGVAWPTVLFLAAAMAYADVFWMVSLREAAGAIERTSDPFADWLRESTLLLPSYVVAVLAARAVRRRGDPPGEGEARSFAATALALAGLGTVVGVLVLAASSFYDYRLEVALLEHTTHTGCLEACVESQRTSTLALQLTSLGYGSAIILATNLAAVGWIAALLGGRLRLDGSGASRRPRVATAMRPRDGLTTVIAATLLGAAVLHGAVVPEHVAQWPVAGAFFMVLACAQAAAAVAVLRHSGRSSWTGAVLVSAVPLVTWLWSRSVGLPWGPDAGTAEQPGLADLASVALELATLALLATRLRRRRPDRSPPVTADRTRLAVVALVAVTALGLGGSHLAWLDVTSGDDHGPVR